MAEHRKVFMIGPIGIPGTESHRAYQNALTYIVRKALPEPDWKVTRADEDNAPDSITSRIIRSILDADLIVADLTDQNPNVFYELAVAHGHRKPVVHLITKDQSIPFDVKDQRAVIYDLTDPASVDDATRRVAAAAQHALDSNDQPENPQSSYERFQTISGGADQPSVIGLEVAEMLEQILARVSALDARVSAEARSAQAIAGLEAAVKFAAERGLARPTGPTWASLAEGDRAARGTRATDYIVETVNREAARRSTEDQPE